MRFVIVSGMSGAGKSTALKVLEDFGFFCVDNLPVALLPNFGEIASDRQTEVDKVAVGVDIRNGEQLTRLNSQLEVLCELGIEYEILFLDAEDETLVKRYKETRRSHPLAKEDRIETGIAREREMISFIRDRADYIIDTTTLLTRELRQDVEKILSGMRNMVILLSQYSPSDSNMESLQMLIWYLMCVFFRILIMSRHCVRSQVMTVPFRNMS